MVGEEEGRRGGMNSQSVAQASLVPDGNRHSGHYLARSGGSEEQQVGEQNTWTTSYRGVSRLSPQERTPDIGAPVRVSRVTVVPRVLPSGRHRGVPLPHSSSLL